MFGQNVRFLKKSKIFNWPPLCLFNFGLGFFNLHFKLTQMYSNPRLPKLHNYEVLQVQGGGIRNIAL